jgi:hypothetical protein
MIALTKRKEYMTDFKVNAPENQKIEKPNLFWDLIQELSRWMEPTYNYHSKKLKRKILMLK